MQPLSILIFCCFSCLAFGQIDSSDWEGKTVLMIYEYSPLIEDTKQSFRDTWKLTDTIYFKDLNTITHSLDEFGKDTAIIFIKNEWIKYVDCFNSMNYSGDCFGYGISTRIDFRNFKTEKWEEFRYFNPKVGKISFDKVISASSKPKTIDDFSKIVRNIYCNENEEEAINKWLESKSITYVFSKNNEYRNYQKNDLLFIYKGEWSDNTYFELVDNETGRVIEKIPLEPK
ncbi:MAG: hypothetical protein AB8G11_19540 [Saprospiraceae bacterium]